MERVGQTLNRTGHHGSGNATDLTKQILADHLKRTTKHDTCSEVTCSSTDEGTCNKWLVELELVKDTFKTSKEGNNYDQNCRNN